MSVAATKKSAAKTARKAGARKAGAGKAAAKTGAGKPGKAEAALRPGDHVQWRTSQGPTRGVVKRKLTAPADIKGHHASASPDNPEYLVESDRSHAQAIHKPGALKKVR